jgi:hypothetical protein
MNISLLSNIAVPLRDKVPRGTQYTLPKGVHREGCRLVAGTAF